MEVALRREGLALLLDLAIRNNATWCAAVTRAHGIESEIGEHYWSTGGAVPPYYSNLVTRTREEGELAQLARIGELVAARPRPGWGIKDSFARLDSGVLAELGLRELFLARWYGAEADAPESESETRLRFTPVADAAELARWEEAWQLSSPAPGLRVFPPSLLSDPDVTFLAARRGEDLAGGAIANVSEGVIGVSNVFALPGEGGAPFLRDCARAVRRLRSERALVGYGPARELAALGPLGFGDLGPLRVFVTAC